MPKFRAVQFEVRPVVVSDDGENLTPVEIQPILVLASEFADFPAAFAEQLEALAEAETE